MTTISFYKSLKQSDLTALSTLETIHNVLAITDIHALKRYTHFVIECPDEKQQELQEDLPKQFYFLNPIKEQLESSISCSENQFLIQVSYKNTYDQHPLHNKICRSFNLNNLVCTESTLWKVSCTNPSGFNRVQTAFQKQDHALFQLLANPVLHNLHILKQS